MKPGILFLDDDINLLASVKRYLRKYSDQWDSYYAASFEEAKVIIKNEKIDIALLDVNLPQKNGFDMLNFIKNNKNYQSIEIVMLTGLEDRNLKREALNLGAADLLQKPIQWEELVARLRSTLKVKLYQDELVEKNRLLQEELIEAQKMEITEVLATGVIHDISNIFTVIKNYPDIIKDRLHDNLNVEDELKKIEFAAERAESILRQILSFAKTDAIENITVDINQILEETISIFRPGLPVNISMDIKLSKQPLTGVYNKLHLTQIFMNLIINAKDALKNSPGTIEILTEKKKIFNEDIETGMIFNIIKISDTGKGIRPESLSRIFEKKFTTKEGGKNFGFGLPVVKILVDKLGGNIKVESEVNVGTTFIVLLPVKE